MTHLVIGRLPKIPIDELLTHKVTFLSEAVLNEFLQEKAPPDSAKYLLQEDEHTPETIKNLKALLLSEDAANVALAIELIESGGFPPELHTELFMAYKMVDDTSIKTKIKPTLEKYSSEKAKEAMRQRMLLYSEHMDEQKLRRNINKYTKDNELDGIKIARYFWKRYQKGILYMFSYGNNEQIIEILPPGDTLDLSGHQINTLPDALLQCTWLKHIKLDDCDFTLFPKVLTQLSGVETLSLSKNYMWSLPKTMTNMSQLKKLNLDYNFLDPFPEIVYQLKQLESFSFKTWSDPPVYSKALKKLKKELPKCEVIWK